MLFLFDEKQFLRIFSKELPYFSYICTLAIISNQEMKAFAKHRFQHINHKSFSIRLFALSTTLVSSDAR